MSAYSRGATAMLPLPLSNRMEIATVGRAGGAVDGRNSLAFDEGE
jgi:hypothetical protein